MNPKNRTFISLNSFITIRKFQKGMVLPMEGGLTLGWAGKKISTNR